MSASAIDRCCASCCGNVARGLLMTRDSAGKAGSAGTCAPSHFSSPTSRVPASRLAERNPMSERPVLANQTRILRNQTRLLLNQRKLDQVIRNQKAIASNQAAILLNQRKLDQVLANQKTIEANQAKILANQTKILGR